MSERRRNISHTERLLQMNNDSIREEYEREGGPDLHPDTYEEDGGTLLDVFGICVCVLFVAAVIYKVIG